MSSSNWATLERFFFQELKIAQSGHTVYDIGSRTNFRIDARRNFQIISSSEEIYFYDTE